MEDLHPDTVAISLPTPFPVGPVNVYLVKSDPPVLVDAGLRSDAAYDTLRAALGEHGVAVGDLDAVLITHGHVDHVGLLPLILGDSKATAYAHPYAVARFREGEKAEEDAQRFMADLLREFGAPEPVIGECVRNRKQYRPYASKAVEAVKAEDGGAVGPYTAYHVPGHSPSDTLFVEHRRSLAFTGDHILTTVNPNPLLRRPHPGPRRAKSLVEYRESLARTRQLELATCYPGHGRPITDVHQVIDRILARQDRRTDEVVRLLRKGETTPYALCRRLFPNLKTDGLYLGLSVAVGHLELLEEQHQAVVKRRNGVLYYAPLVSTT